MQAINILSVLRNIARKIEVILPLHPRTRKMIEQFSLSIEGIKVVEPVPYLTMVGIPATQIGWMSEYGEKLFFEGDKAICPHTNDEYILENNQVSKYYKL